MAYYIAPSFLNKLAVHITKNYLELPQVKVPLILGIHGRKGEGKTFQCELAFKKMGVEVIHISGGELESPDAGDPARLIRLRYREAAELVRVRGCMAVLMINDLDAGAGRFDRMTQYTVNTQMVNNTLMNIADKPTNVQLPGSYDEKPLPRIPIITTGNDFATLYAPLIRDGRMQKFYWEPSHEDRLGIVGGMFASDGVSAADVEVLVTEFDDQAIDFFGAVRSQLYDEQITQFIHSVGIENIASNVVNTINPPTFGKPNFQLERLIEAGKQLVQEQDRVRTMGLVSEYNQAVTPTGGAYNGSMRSSRKDTALLTPPKDNPLTPYIFSAGHEHTNRRKGLGKRDAQAAEIERRAVGRSFKEMVRDRATAGHSNHSSFTSSNSSGNPSGSPSGSASVSAESTQAFETVVSNILGQGHRLGIEHVDQRRFRVNSWQCYATLDTTSQAQALETLKTCIQEFPDHYIRLISIDRHSNRRINESVIRRPG